MTSAATHNSSEGLSVFKLPIGLTHRFCYWDADIIRDHHVVSEHFLSQPRQTVLVEPPKNVQVTGRERASVETDRGFPPFGGE